MNKLVVKPEFREWIEGLSKAYRSAQLKASVSVNSELIRFYFFSAKRFIRTNSKTNTDHLFFI